MAAGVTAGFNRSLGSCELTGMLVRYYARI